MKHKHWRDAMSREFNSTNENYTWDLVEVTEKMNVVGCRWVFTIKYNSDGTIDRYKARIVAKGYHQQQGIDYEDTFSPVIKLTTIRIVLGLAVNNDWPVRQIDVNTAFLQGHLNEEVFMSQPPGFTDSDRPTHVCRLKKALYGLKQAPRAWYSELKHFLLQTGFHNSLADTSLFILKHHKTFVYVLVYVDDILITGSDPTAVQRVITSLSTRFSIKDMGYLGYFLGIETIRTPHGLHLKQRKYITDLLTKANMLHAKPVATPLASHPKLTLISGSPLTLMSLMLLINSRSLCIAQHQIIGKLQRGFFAISPGHSIMASISGKKLRLLLFMRFRTPTGLVMLMTMSLLMLTSSFLARSLSPGQQRSKLESLDLLLKQSTVQWQTQPPN